MRGVRGRPPLCQEPTQPVTTRLPQSVADAAMRMAIRQGQSLHHVVREAVRDFVARNRQDAVPPEH